MKEQDHKIISDVAYSSSETVGYIASHYPYEKNPFHHTLRVGEVNCEK